MDLSITKCQKEGKMFKNKSADGRNNISGIKIAEIRKAKSPKMSQRMLADILQLEGLDIDKNAVQKIESGQRFITDIEVKIIAKALNVNYSDLLD
jgi:DNA-binding transcriptional regulator YiaG